MLIAIFHCGSERKELQVAIYSRECLMRVLVPSSVVYRPCAAAVLSTISLLISRATRITVEEVSSKQRRPVD